jgi:carbonic anhydrase
MTLLTLELPATDRLHACVWFLAIMADINQLFLQNRAWAESMLEQDAQYFKRLSEGQNPDYLWIGCSDSRVSATRITGLEPGSIFVQRNVANVVPHTDVNCLSVLQYAVEVLKVEHIIVCGHYGCGGVRAACTGEQHGLIDNWLRHIKDVYHHNREELDALAQGEAREDRLCELNVGAQVANVCKTTIVQDAWKRGQSISVNAWIYGLQDGLLSPLGDAITGVDEVPAIFRY